MMPQEPFDLKRFLTAQEAVYPQVISELRAGQKRTHWMWFIFPQIAGLGSSSMAQRYAISGTEEASAYLAHPVLGARLRECTALVNEAEAPLEELLDYPDDLKFYSCVTLFHAIAPKERVFADALELYFGREPDRATLSRLSTPQIQPSC